MKIDGGCHCGSVTYEAEADPANVVICHCTDCQTLSGSAFRTAVFTEEGSFRLLTGTLKVYVKVSESGTRREQTFCPECGSPIYSASVGDGPKVHSVRLGTVRQRDRLVPQRQIWCRSAQAWAADIGAIPEIETQPALSRSGAIGRGR